MSNADIRKIITDFEKISAFPHEVVDLLLYRVNTATDFAHQFGDMPDGDYNASSTAYDKAMKLIQKHKLEAYFKEKAEDILQYDNLDYWYIEQMEDMYEECFGEKSMRRSTTRKRNMGFPFVIVPKR